MHLQKWPVEREEWLKTQVAAEYSASIIANMYEKKFGQRMTRSAVLGKTFRMGLRPKKYPNTSRRLITDSKARFLNGHAWKPRPKRAVKVDRPPLWVPLLDLRLKQCRYPQGDGPFVFCGLPPKLGSPYCDAHHRICHSPPRER